MSCAPSDDAFVASIDRAFQTHAGASARLDRAGLQKALGIRSDELAARSFALFDADGDGGITRDEFVATVRTLVAGEPKEKVRFAFRLHDENGDGELTEDELVKMFALGLMEDDLRATPEDVARLAAAFFADADSDKNGRISFDEFHAALAKRPDLLAQMTRGEARWIAPNEDLLERLRPSEKGPSRLLANSLAPLAFLAIFIALDVLVFGQALLAHSRGKVPPTLLDKLGRGATGCLQLNLGFLLFAVARRVLTRVRASALGRVLAVDHAVAFHKLVGYSMVAFGLVHTAARIVSFTRPGKRTFEAQLLGKEGLTGLLLILCFLVMWAFALELVRRSRRFELFYVTHLLWMPVLVLLALHAPSMLAWGGLAIAALAFEMVTRTKRRARPALVRESRALRSGVTRLLLERPAGFTHEPGDYVFLNVPELAKHEWHPFTLSSAPEDPALGLHVRSLGNWTHALRRHVEEGRALTARLDGPYGSPTHHVWGAKVAVMIAAGIGVTPFASVLSSYAQRAAQGKPRGRLEKAHFFWLNRDQYSFEWFGALLADLESQGLGNRLTLRAFMTGGHGGLSAAGLEVARELASEAGLADVVTGLKAKTTMGHPDWEAELRALKEAHAPELPAVFFCGPPGLGKKIARACATLGLPFREEQF